ncbi:phosphotransferase [bacterium]|nr:phosphotransferase [bacterium]
MTQSLGANLTTPPPVLPEAEALSLVRAHWGLTGSLSALTSERDLNFRLTTAQGRYVVKLANPAEPAGVTRFQTRALLHLETSDLPVPRVIRTRDGATEVATPNGILRVLTWLDGQPLYLSPRTMAQRAAIGRIAARLSLGLQGFSDPAARQDLQWDIRHTSRLAPLLPHVAPDIRPLCADVLSRFDAEVAPHLGACRWQVVHNDLNPHNVLTDPAEPDRIAGVLDFGDMVETPLVCDAAVAACYLVDPAAPFESLAAFARAYDATLPLTALERRLFPVLTEARMLTSLAIASARAARFPENAAYILRNLATARAGLLAMQGLTLSTLWTT